MKINNIRMYLGSMLTGLFLVAAFMLPDNVQAQLHEVDQAIFGMDCAPCAYAVENRMKRMDGATNVNLSLNEGNTVVEFAPDNTATLEEIREAIQKGGFDARDATLRLTGILSREAEKWILLLPSDEQFQLDQYEDMISESDLQKQNGQQITLTGHVPKGYEPHEQGWLINIMDDV